MNLSPDAELFVFLLLILALVYTGLRRPGRFLFLCGFTLPLATPRLDVGVGLDFCKLVAPLGLALLMLSSARRRPALNVKLRPFGWFLVYTCIVTFVWMVLEYNWLQRYRISQALNLGGGAAQTILKMPVQLGSFIAQILCAYLVPWYARDEHEAKLGVRGYVWGCATSVGAGALSFVLTGVATINTPLIAEYSGSGRLGGLSGEPKFLGANLVMLTVLAFCVFVFDHKREVRHAGLYLGAAIVALFVTMSTSAWLGALIGILTASLLAFISIQRSRLGSLFLLAIAGSMLVAIVSATFLGDLVQARFFARLSGETSELAYQKDAHVFELLRDEPHNILFGYGMGGGDLSLAPYLEFLHLKYGRTPTPGVNGMRFLVDLGLMGLLLIFASALVWRRRLNRDGDYAEAASALACLTALMFCSITAVSGYYFLMGAFLTLAAHRRAVANTQQDALHRPDAPAHALSAGHVERGSLGATPGPAAGLARSPSVRSFTQRDRETGEV